MKINFEEKGERVSFCSLRCGDTFIFSPQTTQDNVPASVCMKGYHEGEESDNPADLWERQAGSVVILQTGEIFNIGVIDELVIPIEGTFVVK